MNLTMTLATVYGLFFSLIGLGIILNRKFYMQVAETVDKEKGLIMIVGIASTVLGLVLAINHTIIDGLLPTVVTALNWVVLLTGVLTLVLTQYALKIITLWKKQSYVVLYEGIVLLILGLVLLSSHLIG